MDMDQIIDDVAAEDELKRREEQDLERALQLSLQESNAQKARSHAHRSISANGSNLSPDRDIKRLDEEIKDIQAQMNHLQTLLNSLLAQREEKLRDIQSAQSVHSAKGKGKAKAVHINYNTEFEWTGGLAAKLKSVFGFDSFRSCQEGICNANIDGRDIVAIMPTGGGKSLGYQLPALMTPGCTLVISPLLALISDQIMHLHDAGVDAVMLTSAMSREENYEVSKRLDAMALGVPGVSEIKLCYVTPEKIANSTKFKSTLDKLYRVNKLARVVIDEAHCVSSLGHDFRPDYQKLGILREMYPKVPIIALSATCPAAVLMDLLKTLRLGPLTTASAATPEGTVLFSTSLYRKNLHYSVLTKPSAAAESITAMRDYILAQHRNDTGIVYCLTKKDAEMVAKELKEKSGGAILTGVYHADVQGAQKKTLHRQWHEGKVKVVCATIAFGLGIDKGDVRFVIHHSLSKSLDGFYQESGRAGRDGKDSDCVLFYRPQDGFSIARLASAKQGDIEKVISMIAFASDLEQCRKIAFANYFNKSSKLSLSSWATDQEDALTPCGHCDNCKRPPEALELLGARARIAAWQILRVMQAGGREVTMAQLCDVARGRGGLKDAASSSGAGATRGGKGKGKAKEMPTVDVNKVAGGKVELSREQTEAVCVRLLVDGYLKFRFQYTYSVNVYLWPSDLAARFTRFSKEDIEKGKGPAFDCALVNKAFAKLHGAAGSHSQPRSTAKAPATHGKRKRQESFSPTPEVESVEVSDSEEDAEWHTSLRGSTSRAQPSPKRPRNGAGGGGTSRAAGASTSGRSWTPPPPHEVIEIDSDSE